MGTAQGELFGETVFLWRKVCIAYLAFKLSGLAVIAVKIRLWAPQEGQEQSSGMSHFLRRETGFILTPYPAIKVRNEEMPVPLMLNDLDFWKFVYFELLIFWRMGIVESPLLERDISADKFISQQFCW